MVARIYAYSHMHTFVSTSWQSDGSAQRSAGMHGGLLGSD